MFAKWRQKWKRARSLRWVADAAERPVICIDGDGKISVANINSLVTIIRGSEVAQITGGEFLIDPAGSALVSFDTTQGGRVRAREQAARYFEREAGVLLPRPRQKSAPA